MKPSRVYHLGEAIRNYCVMLITENRMTQFKLETLRRFYEYIGDLEVNLIEYDPIREWVLEEIKQSMISTDFIKIARDRYCVVKELIFHLYINGEITFCPIAVPPEIESLTRAPFL